LQAEARRSLAKLKDEEALQLQTGSTQADDIPSDVHLLLDDGASEDDSGCPSPVMMQADLTQEKPTIRKKKPVAYQPASMWHSVLTPSEELAAANMAKLQEESPRRRTNRDSPPSAKHSAGVNGSNVVMSGVNFRMTSFWGTALNKNPGMQQAELDATEPPMIDLRGDAPKITSSPKKRKKAKEQRRHHIAKRSGSRQGERQAEVDGELKDSLDTFAPWMCDVDLTGDGNDKPKIKKRANRGDTPGSMWNYNEERASKAKNGTARSLKKTFDCADDTENNNDTLL